MLSNLIGRGGVSRMRPLLPRVSLIRPDRARPIDRIIDYFGGAPRRAAPATPLYARLVPRSDDSRAKITGW